MSISHAETFRNRIRAVGTREIWQIGAVVVTTRIDSSSTRNYDVALETDQSQVMSTKEAAASISPRWSVMELALNSKTMSR
jgi:hypothetical protein